jgi:ribosome-binding protein aMBF1 (putative translation factor)
MIMTILIGPITDTFNEPRDKPKATTITRNASIPSNICVGSRLRIRRTSRGISAKELSEQLRINREDVNAYEEGLKRVGANLLLRIAKLLDVRPDYFFRGYTAEELGNCLKSSP